jgi:NTP pyrophosphatase (non-canonical NTP hydrolase)
MKIEEIGSGSAFFTTDAPFPNNFVYYSEFVARLAKPMGSPTLDILHAAVGVSGEAGELLDAVKKNWAYNKPLDRENIVEELGDLRFYMQHMMNLLNITDHEVIKHNLEKLQKRYAEGYSDKAAQERADKAPEVVPAPEGFIPVPFGYQLDKNDPDWSAL